LSLWRNPGDSFKNSLVQIVIEVVEKLKDDSKTEETSLGSKKLVIYRRVCNQIYSIAPYFDMAEDNSEELKRLLELFRALKRTQPVSPDFVVILDDIESFIVEHVE
jgi:uncharacterized protein (UPF0305 family)